jgi:hypothetical protein
MKLIWVMKISGAVSLDELALDNSRYLPLLGSFGSGGTYDTERHAANNGRKKREDPK